MIRVFAVSSYGDDDPCQTSHAAVAGLMTLSLILAFALCERTDGRTQLVARLNGTAASTTALLGSQFDEQFGALSMVAATPALVRDLEAGHVAILNEQPVSGDRSLP